MSTKTSNRKHTFSIRAPTAYSVMLAGDFTHWAQTPLPLQRRPDGVWTVSATLPAGTHHYRFIIDGKWCDDPECKLRVQNPFGTQNAVIQVPAAAGVAKKAGNREPPRRAP